MLQVLLLGFNNLDLNKFVLLQREDKNGCTWHKTKASVYFTRSLIFLHLCLGRGSTGKVVYFGIIPVCCWFGAPHARQHLNSGGWGSMCVQVSLCLCVISGWVWVNGRSVYVYVRICVCACVLVWLLAPASTRVNYPLLQVCWDSHPLAVRTGRLPSSLAGMGVRNVWPQVFYQKPEINFQVFTALPTYEVCQWCLIVIFTVFSLVDDMPQWSCITTFTYAGTALSPEQLKKAQHEH